MEIKTVKGRNYVQLVDDLGFLHHVGPATPENIYACSYVQGWNDTLKRVYEQIAYYQSKGIPNATSLAMEADNHYRLGTEGEIPEGAIGAHQKEIADKISTYAILEKWIRDNEENGAHLNRAGMQQRIKELYQAASEETKEKWLKQVPPENRSVEPDEGG